MMTDIEIAQQCRMHPIADIAATAGIDESYLCLLYTSPSPRDA